MKTTSILFTVMLSVMSLDATAADHANTDAPAASASAMTSGEVKKIDKETGKITLKHGPIINLDMPAMTMVFRVKDAAMLDSVKVGDQIKFAAEKIEGSLTVTRIEAAN